MESWNPIPYKRSAKTIVLQQRHFFFTQTVIQTASSFLSMGSNWVRGLRHTPRSAAAAKSHRKCLGPGKVHAPSLGTLEAYTPRIALQSLDTLEAHALCPAQLKMSPGGSTAYSCWIPHGWKAGSQLRPRAPCGSPAERCGKDRTSPGMSNRGSPKELGQSGSDHS